MSTERILETLDSHSDVQVDYRLPPPSQVLQASKPQIYNFFQCQRQRYHRISGSVSTLSLHHDLLLISIPSANDGAVCKRLPTSTSDCCWHQFTLHVIHIAMHGQNLGCEYTYSTALFNPPRFEIVYGGDVNYSSRHAGMQGRQGRFRISRRL